MKPRLIIAITISLLCTSCLSDSGNQTLSPNPINEIREQNTQVFNSGDSIIRETDSDSQVSTLTPIDEYREQLAQDILSGGTLFCVIDSEKETVEFSSCILFHQLRD